VEAIYISEQAFLSVILSAAEVYNRECYGLLFGYSLPGKTIVEGAIAYQTAERKFSQVSLYERQHKIIQRVIHEFPKHAYVGEFHSHPFFRGAAGDVALGPEDAFGIREPEIQLVVAINPRKRSVRWSTNRTGTLSGTLAGFHFRIAGYHVLPREQTKTKGKPGRRRSKKDRPRLVRARVFCPYAVGLNPGGEG
jgi:hypothetical protein